MQHDGQKQKITMENFIILLFYLSFTSTFIKSIALDTIAPTETIRDGKTIVSAGGTFEMGFFSPGSSRNRYLGVWYKKISSETIVWVANRDTPLTDSSGVLKLNSSGILVLLNQNNTIIWSSSSSRVVHNPVAQLLDSGNLVIRDVNDLIQENFLWQSFDYPDKTLLPEMKIRRTAKSLDTYLSSWKSAEDPSQGNFTFQLDPSGLQLLVKENSVIKVRSGPWNGIRFSGLLFLSPNSICNFTFVSNPKEISYTTYLVNSLVLSRMVLIEDGVVARFTWSDGINDWVEYLSAPADNCDNYAVCGAYGSCDVRNSPICGCLDRFVPKYEKDWGRADWSGGCVRRMPLDCQTGGDGFIRYSNVKLPEMTNFSANASMTLEECRIACLKNCSCMAYANSDIRERGSGCYFWFSDLIDIKQYTENGQDLYIRVASSEIDFVAEHKESSNRMKKGVIIASSVLTGMLLLGLSFSFLLWRKKKKSQNTIGRTRKQKSCSMNNQEEDPVVPHFDFTIIANATNSFSVNNMLGEGGFGPVYKGLLKDGREIAVKRLSKYSRQGLDEFKNEVKCIAKLQHRNLVKLLGYCIQLEEKLLIYEYMPNKSLDFYVFDETRSMSLDWSMRYHIINGISRGLLYLHQDSRLRIIHRDLKLSNVFLDNDMNPKISDFGMARSLGGNDTQANTKRVVGTYGYMSPEYAIDGLFSVKSDVFSFGVLVLEIVSGKRNRGFNHPDHQLNLLGHAWILFKEGRFLELIDSSIMESCDPSEVLRAVHVSLLCVQHCPEDRPGMSSVVLMLSGERALPEPKAPGFFTKRKLIEAESSSSKTESCSVNVVTITTIEVR